jgi:hypothetical protein
VLDTVVQVQVLEIERILPVALMQHACAVVGHVEAKGRRKVVRRTDLFVHFLECDATTITREYTLPPQHARAHTESQFDESEHVLDTHRDSPWRSRPDTRFDCPSL